MRAIVSAAYPWMIRICQQLGLREVIGIHPWISQMLAAADLPARDLTSYSDPSDLFHAGEYLWQAVRRLPQGPLSAWLAPQLPKLALAVRALDRAQPDLCLLHNDVEPIPALIGLWAQARSVPAVHIPHAIYLDHPWRGPLGTDVHDLVRATHIAAASPYQARWYAERAAVPIAITGAPRWDHLPRFRQEDPARFRSMIGLRKGELAVLYGTSWAQPTTAAGARVDPFRHFLAFLESAKHWPPRAFALIVKLHPNQGDGERYREALQASGLKGLISRDHLEPLLLAADRVICFGVSNLLLEAWYLGRPALAHGARPPWGGPSLEWEVPWEEVLGAALPQGLEEYMGPVGGATERVVEWIVHACTHHPIPESPAERGHRLDPVPRARRGDPADRPGASLGRRRRADSAAHAPSDGSDGRGVEDLRPMAAVPAGGARESALLDLRDQAACDPAAASTGAVLA